jgi:hypothetical protein
MASLPTSLAARSLKLLLPVSRQNPIFEGIRYQRKQAPLDEKKIAFYEKLVAKCPRFEHNGKNLPYTSANGYMFSQLNKDDELGIRFSKEVQEKYIKELKTTYFTSYGAVMRGYVLMPEKLWKDLDRLAEYLNEGYDYVMRLEAK